MMKQPNKKLTNLLYYLEDKFGCVPPWGVAYTIYNFLAGKLSCTCCIFWRGMFIGIFIGGLAGTIIRSLINFAG